jgi:hypothetical protein
MGFTSDKKKELMEIDRLFESINEFSLRKQILNEFNRTQVPGMGKNLTYIDGIAGSKPSIDLPKVNKDLLKDINTAAEKSGVEVSITTAKTGHSPGGRHGKYEAVDIAVVIDTLKNVANQTGSSIDNLLQGLKRGEKIDVQDWVKQNFSFLNENKKIKKRSLKTQENINRIKNLLK